MEWEDEAQPSQAAMQPTPEERPAHNETAADQEDEPRRERPRPKRRRLDRKDGCGLVKDAPIGIKETTGADVTDGGVDSIETERANTSEVKKDRRKGKEFQTDKNEDLNDTDILDAAHEFAALLQSGNAYELIDFLATQQIKVSQQKIQENTEG